MYTKEEYEELQSLRYVYTAYEPVAYTRDKMYRVMCTTIGASETFTLQQFFPEKRVWTMRTPDRTTWDILRPAGYFSIYDGEKFGTVEQALTRLDTLSTSAVEAG